MVAEVGFEPTSLATGAYETPENDRFSTLHYGGSCRIRTYELPTCKEGTLAAELRNRIFIFRREN
jgi:hypothetical protein